MHPSNERLTLIGIVDAVVFRNEANGYTILRLAMEDTSPVTVVGCMPGATPGEGLHVQGVWTKHATYGDQFRADVIERSLPKGEGAIYEYLASGVIKGIGSALAKQIVKKFGENALKIIEEEPEQLLEIKGITQKRLNTITHAYRLQMGMRLLLDFLTQHNLPLQFGMPLYQRYGNQALTLIRNNPYLLVDEEIGVEFFVADQVALDLGMDPDHSLRIEAGILFELTYNLSNGHTFIPEKKLILATAQLLSIESTRIAQSLEALILRGDIVQETIANENACYLDYMQEAEVYITTRLLEMCQQVLEPPADLKEILADIQQGQGIEYAPEQEEAILLAASRQIMLLTGGPGTGKTTCLRGVLRLFEALGLETALAAPTGRAAKRMSEACDADATTIHRLLGTQFDPHSGRLVFAHYEEEPLSADAVIVDETSMVDLNLMAALLAALRGDTRLILVGDPDQLPSVGAGNLLSDLIRCKKIPTVRLTEIFRQAQKSGIIINAHRVNQGKMPHLSNHPNDGDFFFLRRKDPLHAVETVVEIVSQRLPEKMGIPPEHIQVLTPTRKHQTGTQALNIALQNALNPPIQGKNQRNFGNIIFREGDRVMQVKNNYNLLWTGLDGHVGGMGVFNGDIGQILSVDNRSQQVIVDYEGRIVTYTHEMLGELEPAYAMTIHKSQGSEYHAVVLILNDGASRLMSRSVLYTAITRARNLLILVGDDYKVAQMVENERQTRRYSGLRVRLVQEFS